MDEWMTTLLTAYEPMLFTTQLNFVHLLPLSYVFLDNYVPKCQMSSGPYGPIF